MNIVFALVVRIVEILMNNFLPYRRLAAAVLILWVEDARGDHGWRNQADAMACAIRNNSVIDLWAAWLGLDPEFIREKVRQAWLPKRKKMVEPVE